jgi:hypothetical protein
MLTRIDLIKIAKGAGIVGLAAGLTYLLEAVDALDFGPSYDPLVTAALAIFINIIRKIRL